MKGAGIVAAAALLAGAADAKVHKLKLNKVPLKEQLVRSVRLSSSTSTFSEQLMLYSIARR